MREKILDCAEILFSKEGYEKVSTKKIAEIVGCNEVTIFRTFKTKKNLLDEIINRFYEKNKIIKLLYESLNGPLNEDIAKTIILYSDFLKQNEKILKLQLKGLGLEQADFLCRIELKNYLVEHFTEQFYLNKIRYSPENFVNNILSSITGDFILKILTGGNFLKIEYNEIFLREKIKFYQKAINSYK